MDKVRNIKYFRESKKHQKWIYKNNIYVDLKDSVNDFCLSLVTELKPKTILCLGGYTNFDVFFATQYLDYDIHIVNVDPIVGGGQNESKNDVSSKQEKIKEHFKFKGKYTWIQELADLNRVKERKWDLIWDAGCFAENIKLIPKNQTLFYYHYDHPGQLFNELKEIDKVTPIQGMARGMSFHGNIQKHIIKVIGTDPYHSINLQKTEKTPTTLSHCNEVSWPYNGERIIPLVGAGLENNEWKYQYILD